MVANPTTPSIHPSIPPSTRPCSLSPSLSVSASLARSRGLQTMPAGIEPSGKKSHDQERPDSNPVSDTLSLILAEICDGVEGFLSLSEE